MTPMALNAKQAAQYLGVSRTHFYKVIKPYVKASNLAAPSSRKPLYRWTKQELDGFLEQRKA